LVAIFAQGVGQKERAQGLFNLWARGRKTKTGLARFFFFFLVLFLFHRTSGTIPGITDRRDAKS
jgi:hypothetical protein